MTYFRLSFKLQCGAHVVLDSYLIRHKFSRQVTLKFYSVNSIRFSLMKWRKLTLSCYVSFLSNYIIFYKSSQSSRIYLCMLWALYSKNWVKRLNQFWFFFFVPYLPFCYILDFFFYTLFICFMKTSDLNIPLVTSGKVLWL